jgi:hypothetical protein
MMRTPDKNFALLYFESESVLPVLNNFTPGEKYHFLWYDTITGKWLEDNDAVLVADDNGQLNLPEFPGGGEKSTRDWAAKIVVIGD